jgi:hypothetical protein
MKGKEKFYNVHKTIFRDPKMCFMSLPNKFLKTQVFMFRGTGRKTDMH